MCHGSIDPKILMREAEGRMACVIESASDMVENPGLPPEFMGGMHGVWVRLLVRLGLFESQNV